MLNNISKKIIVASSSILMTLTLVGCGGLGGPTPQELVAKKYTISNGIGEEVSLSKPYFYIENGVIKLSNSDTIMDEEGSIWNAKAFNKTIYYVVKNENNNHLKLKNQYGKLIKDFGETNHSATYNYNNKMYIATTSVTDSKIYSNVYSNLFEFDGVKPKLIKKKIAAGGKFKVGLNTKSWLDKYEKQSFGYKRGRGYEWAFYNINDGQRNDIKPSLIPNGGYTFFGKKMGYKYEFMLGFVGDTAVYIYEYQYNDRAGKTQSKYILEAQNLSSGKAIVLLDDKNKNFSFLTNKRDVVFRDGDRIIDMRTLRPSKIDNNFTSIELTDGYSTMGGGFKTTQYKKYSMRKIYLARGQGNKLFDYR